MTAQTLTPENAEDTENKNPSLTKREKEIFLLVIEGHASQKVADTLFISKRTVDFHLANIYNKLQVSNRMQALSRASRLGLV